MSLIGHLHICGANKVETMVANPLNRIGAVISIESEPPDFKYPKHGQAPRLSSVSQLILRIDDTAHHKSDVSRLGLRNPPTDEHLLRAFEFVDAFHQEGRLSDILINCAHG